MIFSSQYFTSFGLILLNFLSSSYLFLLLFSFFFLNIFFNMFHFRINDFFFSCARTVFSYFNIVESTSNKLFASGHKAHFFAIRYLKCQRALTPFSWSIVSFPSILFWFTGSSKLLIIELSADRLVWCRFTSVTGASEV